MLRKIKTLLPQEVKNIYHQMRSILATLWYGFPAKNLKIIGVTGTDGKTTTATLIYHLLKTAGHKAALVSTVAAYIGDKKVDTGFHVTTPDAWKLQKLLREIADKKYDYLVLEVTSHGLDQHRLWGIGFEIGVLTNITREHLDYHQTFANYVRAKQKLFERSKLAVINKNYDLFKDLETPKVFYKVKGNYHQENVAAAGTVARQLGIKKKIIHSAVTSFPGVPGRLEEIKNKRGIKIYIDFAHTPNALENVLTYLAKRKTRGQKLIVVFGCASERDESKRPVMGEIATWLADISVFTSEDPRWENPDKIIDEIAAGVKKKQAKFYEIANRGKAIGFAINKLAKKGDTVVICGKGHEQSMSIRGIEHPWSDRRAVVNALK